MSLSKLLKNKGKPRSERSKAKISERLKRENNPNYGKHFSEEWRRNHSALLKGKHWKVVDGKRIWF